MEKIARIYLKRYKKDLLPLALSVGGFIMLVRIIIPQFGIISDLNNQITSQIDTNVRLNESIEALNGINESELERDYELAMQALPTDKSIGAVFEALTIAAGKSNVTIGGLNIQVGSVYSQETGKIKESNVDGVPFLNMIVRVSGTNTIDITNFAQALYETLPVAEINTISVSDTAGEFDVNFYFKPINEAGFKAQTQVAPLTPAQRELITKLETWSQ